MSIRLSLWCVLSFFIEENCRGQIKIANVDGLESELYNRVKKGLGYYPGRIPYIGPDGTMETVIGFREDCVRGDGTTVPCASQPQLVEMEIPSGKIGRAHV